MVDCHAHLDGLGDLYDSHQEAKSVGVKGIIAMGMDIESNKKILQIAQGSHGYVYPTLG